MLFYHEIATRWRLPPSTWAWTSGSEKMVHSDWISILAIHIQGECEGCHRFGFHDRLVADLINLKAYMSTAKNCGGSTFWKNLVGGGSHKNFKKFFRGYENQLQNLIKNFQKYWKKFKICKKKSLKFCNLPQNFGKNSLKIFCQLCQQNL